ncbi:SPX domain-containing protein [Phycomyces blakesleeanus]|uniref:SPX domain-containing protein n=1 Tax=Phycomyces blakesleeanus TaxID=4837 RepID=A0ABR3B6K6_PHYBL
MKFAKYLESESIPEWRKAYLNYKGLKKKLKPVDKFRKASERKSAIDLDNTFHEYDSDSDQEYTGRKRHSQYGPPNATYHWRNAPLAGDDDPHSRRNSFPRSILQALTARFNKDDNELHRSPSRPVSIQSNTTLSVFDEVLLHASEPERAFFMMLNEELEKISDFYDEKERESREKLEVLKVQMQLVGDYGRLLAEQEPASEDSLVDQVYNPVQWFKRYYKDRKISLHSSMDYEVSQDISYNVARNRLKKALTEFYRSLEFLRSYKVNKYTHMSRSDTKFIYASF